MFAQLWAIIEALFQENQQFQETIQHLRDEIAVLKGEKPKPVFKPSGMEAKTKAGTPESAQNATAQTDKPQKRPGSAKRSKTKELVIHHEEIVKPKQPIPQGSRFKGYRDFVVQDIIITANNTRYRLETWQTPTGEWLCGEVPQHLNGSHFGPTLRSFVLYQHNHCQVTQPLLHEQLGEWGIDISVGQINALLSQHNEAFFAESDQILATGLAVSQWITVDDSGARHKGKNGYVTQIGNDWFTWFGSTYSKSRVNFLELLQAGNRRYSLNQYALEYLDEHKLPQKPLQSLVANPPIAIVDSKAWEQYLNGLGIVVERHRIIATESALLGGLIDNGFSLDLVIISDGAGQFAILLHALCWVHAERLIHKLIPCNDGQRADQERVRNEIWSLYGDLKAYKLKPDAAQIPVLEARFDTIFTQRTSFETLNQLLNQLHGHKDKLLLVLKRPDIPLHTNGSENDIRGHVKWRKVSGGTRNDLGKRCRNAFGLKKDVP